MQYNVKFNQLVKETLNLEIINTEPRFFFSLNNNNNKKLRLISICTHEG